MIVIGLLLGLFQMTLVDQTPNQCVWSHDRKYRYEWRRQWNPKLLWCNFIMLNPSTADEYQTDPTVNRCAQMALQWGYGGLIVTNLFAYVSTTPHELYRKSRPIGVLNDEAILHAFNFSELIVVAWGTHGKYQNRDLDVMALLPHYDVNALQINKDGTPKHPLYVPYVAKEKLLSYSYQGRVVVELQ